MVAPPNFSLRLSTAPRARPKDSELVFGRIFTDHMAIADYDVDRGGWYDPRVVPYGPLSLDPAAAVLHYAQAMFEGLKAFRGADGQIRLFRIDRHCRRMNSGAERLCIPPPDEALIRGAVMALVGCFDRSPTSAFVLPTRRLARPAAPPPPAAPSARLPRG